MSREVDNSAERLEMSGRQAVDNSAACYIRLSGLLTDDVMRVEHDCSCTFCGEYGTHLLICRSKQLAAESVATLVSGPKVAETERCVALILAAGVDAGPGEMEGVEHRK
jgi:hypothetical protein